MTYNLIATCAAGVEHLVAGEIKSFAGRNITQEKGVVIWQGSMESGYRACLWSRFSSRILLQIAQFETVDEQSLYQRCYDIEWEKHFSCKETFAVTCTLGEGALIKHSKFASLRVKDAVADRFRTREGKRPSVQTLRPDIRINLHIHQKEASVAIDLSGESLHRRGYREETGIAPLKETLAASIITLTGWKGEDPDILLVDPMCGSATLLIEAALIYGDSAPGLYRTYFGFKGWKGHKRSLWDKLVDEAVSREEKGLNRKWPAILGYDADPVVVAAARNNITRAGLEDKIRVNQGELATLHRPGKTGLVVCNPPYGERLSETEGVSQLYRALGRILMERFDGWRAGVFISNPGFADKIGLDWEITHRLFNGPLACRLLVGSATSRPPKPFPALFREKFSQPSSEQEGADFTNRLIKNLGKLMKWAGKEKVSCFRVYDRDIPEYNISVDIYDNWVHVQEYAPPSSVDPDSASRRLALALQSVREVFGIKRDRVFIKKRHRQRGKHQYEKKAGHGKLLEVREGECLFLVNLSDYIDTGLFIDHRPIRKMIGQEVRGKRFLNLFGYTGTATVSAAQGGAVSTTTVDLSTTYLSWASLNLSLNGFSALNHERVKADCLEWTRKTKKRFDLIFIDPPTFSNTKKAGRTFDVQRDHGQLIRQALARLDRGGKVFFSTNFRKFRLDESLPIDFDVDDISDRTIPFDFKRNKKIHRCWEIRNREE